jgi:putative peptidoglycan lipid II flippase
MTSHQAIAGAALVIMVGNVVSRLLGLAREQVMAWLFGATGATDAFVAASAVPTIIYDLLIGGAISAALVPSFVAASADRARLWRLVSSILSLAGLLLACTAALLAVFAEPLLGIFGHGFSAEQHAHAVAMVRVMLVAVVFQGLAGVLMAVLYAANRFALPAFAPAAYNGAIILAGLALHEVLGIEALVVGVLLGALTQLALQLGGLRDLRFRPRLDLASPEVRAVLRLYAPVAAGMLVSIAGITLDRYFASQLEAGSMTVMGYATRLIQFPLGLVANATAFAVLPTLSRQASSLATAKGGTGGGSEGSAGGGDLQAYRETLRFGLKLVWLLMVPATLGLALLSEPLVRLLFEHRAFTAADTARTATVFLFYAPQLPLTAVDQLLIFAYYARRDTVTPVLVGVVAVLLYLACALATLDRLGVNGLALANAVQNGSHGVILLALLWRALGGLGAGHLASFCGRVLGATALMGAAMLLAWPLLQTAAGQDVPGLAAFTAAELALGGLVYGAAVLLLRLPEARVLVDLARARLARRGAEA